MQLGSVLRQPDDSNVAASSIGRCVSQPARFQNLRCAASAMLAVGILFASSSAWAVVVPPGPHTFDGNLPGGRIRAV